MAVLQECLVTAGVSLARLEAVSHLGCHAVSGAAKSPRAALLDPPPFDPSKLSVEYLPGSRGAAVTAGRRYTLTHNDVTGSLQLSIGHEYNRRQLDGWYTRILRDEILAEWQDTPTPAPPSSGSSPAATGSGSDADECPARSGGGAVPSLHVYCHVSGEELWPAPPQLRAFIFRREMALVLDTITHAEAAALVAAPRLRAAPVYVHLRSDVPALDRVVDGDGGAPGGATCGARWDGGASWDGEDGGDARASAAQQQQQQQQQPRQPPLAAAAADAPVALNASMAAPASQLPASSQPCAPMAVGSSLAGGGSTSSEGSAGSVSALGAANGAVSLLADCPSWLSAGAVAADGRQRAAAEAVPIVASNRSRQR
ncbi:hypothetical protein CHLNCDRAFT_142305 [Chlorella variabilis]|uniref:Staygreen protein domain-containing protein n=1 Tax=Chlorella variabilis TaxID=554065 RepID=E1Z893_CHLVA|nr:hypothetical protein CHLNCDRAFT_142305 [Chlorella variabilis]EFN58306.1 hypothetical protein CHLNCDRAFT_142305 [Chlorella variabilis]|eukprot:XP_005850408.1 hypothetical protein CHLNCDRAFT_142305 [Chlorella variabilis]